MKERAAAICSGEAKGPRGGTGIDIRDGGPSEFSLGRDSHWEQPEELFERALEDAPIGIALVSPSGRWLKVNRSLCELIGYSEEELLSLTFQDVTHPGDLGVDLVAVRQLLDGELRRFETEKRYTHASGHPVRVLLSVSLVREPSGRPLYFICHIQDISGRKEAEARQRAQEERYRRQRDAVILFGSGEIDSSDPSTAIRKLTEVSAKTLGVARASFWQYSEDRRAIRCVDLYEAASGSHSNGLELSEADYPGYFESLAEHDVIQAHDARTDPRTSEFRDNYLRPLGITSMLDAPVAPDSDFGGVLCHEHIGPPRRWTADEESFAVAAASRLALVLEAAERHRVAGEHRRTLVQLEQMLAHSPAVTFRLEVQGERFVPLATSDNITMMLGYSTAETMIPGWWLWNLHPDDKEAAVAGMHALFEQGSARREYRFRHKDGTYHWIEDNQRVVRDLDGEPSEAVGVWLDITERKRAEAEYQKLNKELMEVSRQAGMAEVATSVLHNVGNVLNSVNVASSLMADRLRGSKVASLLKGVQLLREHADDLPSFLANDPLGRKLPDFFLQVGDVLAAEQGHALTELREIQKNIDHIKEIVFMQQSLSKVYGTTETLDVGELVEHSLRVNQASLNRHEIKVRMEIEPLPPVEIDRHRLLQILINLVRNAQDACMEAPTPEKELSVKVSAGDGYIRVAVSDNGIGIAPENLTRIFAHGFTTKAHGHGFGLHASALCARELGGSLTVHSDGLGTGATFALELPAQSERPRDPTDAQTA